MIDFHVARDKLLQFETADEIAEFLFEQGVKGTRALSTSCAIANWMTETTGIGVAVNQIEMWESYNGAVVNYGGLVLHRHSDAISSFVIKFDEGHYPELIADPDDAKICRMGKDMNIEPPCWQPIYAIPMEFSA